MLTRLDDISWDKSIILGIDQDTVQRATEVNHEMTWIRPNVRSSRSPLLQLSEGHLTFRSLLKITLNHESNRIWTYNFPFLRSPESKMGIYIWKMQVDLQVTLKKTVNGTKWWPPNNFYRSHFPEISLSWRVTWGHRVSWMLYFSFTWHSTYCQTQPTVSFDNPRRVPKTITFFINSLCMN